MKTKSIIIGALIACNTLVSAEPEKKPFIREGAEKIAENNGYIQLPVADTKKLELQKKLDAYQLKNKITDIRGHLLKIQILLAQTNEHSGSMVVEMIGKGGESLDSCTITYTEDGWMDDSTRGQRYQFQVKLKGEKLILHKANAWVQPWPDRFESTKEYIKKHKIQWGAIRVQPELGI